MLKKLKKNLSKILNTFENIMENLAFAQAPLNCFKQANVYIFFYFQMFPS